LAYLSASLSVTSTARAGSNIENHSTQANRIVVADGGLVTKAADSIDIDCFGQSSPRWLAFFSRL
jgi:hypothetical protein